MSGCRSVYSCNLTCVHLNINTCVGRSRLVNLIEELRVDADLRVEITTDETDLVKLTFSGTPDVGFPLRREVRDIPGEVIRRVWNEGLRDYDIA